MSTKKSGLGRGLAALLDTTPIDNEQNNNPIKDATSAANSVMDNIVHTGMVAQISLNQIEANPFQPRTEFDETALRELSESISIQGIIQPITVRKMGHDRYQIISGERLQEN